MSLQPVHFLIRFLTLIHDLVSFTEQYLGGEW